MSNEQLKPDVEIEHTIQPRENLQLFRFVKTVTFECERCKNEGFHKKTQKTAKNLAIIDGDWARKICNGCYGFLTSKM